MYLQGRKSKKKTSNSSLDWPRERESGMKTLLNLVQLNIHRLWDPPIAEEEFVRQVDEKSCVHSNNCSLVHFIRQSVY